MTTLPTSDSQVRPVPPPHWSARGMNFVDPDREEWMLQYLARANRGPLSSEGLRELFEEILALSKREVERGG